MKRTPVWVLRNGRPVAVWGPLATTTGQSWRSRQSQLRQNGHPQLWRAPSPRSEMDSKMFPSFLSTLLHILHLILHHPTGERYPHFHHVRHLREPPGVHIDQKVTVIRTASSKPDVSGVHHNANRIVKVIWEICSKWQCQLFVVNNWNNCPKNGILYIKIFIPGPLVMTPLWKMSVV